MIKKILDFFEDGIWQIFLKDISGPKAWFIRSLRIAILAVRRFIMQNSARDATVLTYYSLLNLVPLLAVIFAIAKGFGLEKIVVEQIVSFAREANWQADITNQLLTFSKSLLNRAKGGLIAGVGIVLLFYTVISILGKIEDTFNSIWNVKKSRTLSRKFADYLSILVVAPALFAISSSITVVTSSHIKAIADAIAHLGPLGSLVLVVMKLLPYLTMWVLMAAVYLLMPNTKVPIRYGILAAVVSGTIFQIVQWVYIKFQIGVSSQGAIYGSFAALPLFLGWLQISWMVVLFGAHIAHAGEHYETFGLNPDFSRIGRASERFLVLKVFHLLVKNFAAGQKPLTAQEVAYNLMIPVSLVKQILFELTGSGIVVEVTKGIRKEASFQPGKPTENLTIKQVLDTYEKTGFSDVKAPLFQTNDELVNSLKLLSEAIEKSPGNTILKNI